MIGVWDLFSSYCGVMVGIWNSYVVACKIMLVSVVKWLASGTPMHSLWFKAPILIAVV